jgi:hydrogenase expression/formation protein HypC
MCLAVSGRILTIHHRPPAAAALSGAAAANGTTEPGQTAEPGQINVPDLTAGQRDDPLWRVAEVDFGGVRQLVSLAFLPDAQAGDQVLVHVGIALSLVE